MPPFFRVDRGNFVPYLLIALTTLAPIFYGEYQYQRAEKVNHRFERRLRAAERERPNDDARGAAELIGANRASIAEADQAKTAVLDRRFELESGYCSRYVRQVVEATHSSTKYSYLFGASAKISANLFLASPYGYHWPAEKSKLGGVIQPGDILFKRRGSGGYGHVGIYVGDIPGVGKQLVAENSSTSIGRIQGAKGYRTLAQFNNDGKLDVVGRLPLPANYKAPARSVLASTPQPKTSQPVPRLILGVSHRGKISYHVVGDARLEGGHWNANAMRITSALYQKASVSTRVGVIAYLKTHGAAPYAIGQHLTDKADPRTYVFVNLT
jgi:hypothetical protein